MDKNTLSNYGWIVIAVLVLSVMIALATPFGRFIEQGVRATTEGLFDTSKNAVNTAFEDLGVQMKDQEFEEGYQGGGTPNTPKDTSGITVSKYLADKNCHTYQYQHNDSCYIFEEKTLTWEEVCEIYDVTPERIGYGAFREDQSLMKIVIPNTVTYIEGSAFEGCINLTEVIIPDSVTTISSGAFSGCMSLTSIKLPSGLTMIDSYILDRTAITNLVIPEGVTHIDNDSFIDTPLVSITIPASVTYMSSTTFEWCHTLEVVNFGGKINEWNTLTEYIHWSSIEREFITINCSDGSFELHPSDFA